MRNLTIEQVLPLQYQEEFCKQHHCQDVDLMMVGDAPIVVGTMEEVTECYYGNMLIQDVIAGEWPIDVVQDWITEYVMRKVQDFCDDMHIEMADLAAMLQWNAVKYNFLVPEYEMEEEAKDADYDYWLECSQDAMWITKHC